eukprot:Tbor_TRINITY_DN4843_c0_g1::TRINITY_DN4843_c0_g1_i1::g.1359::m.1359
MLQDRLHRTIRRRQDLHDVPDFERNMNDRTAEEIYTQLWLGALRDNKDPNDTDDEPEYEGYIAPTFDYAKGAAMLQEEKARTDRINRARKEAIRVYRSKLPGRNNRGAKDMVTSASLDPKSVFARLVEESELFHGRGAFHNDSSSFSSSKQVTGRKRKRDELNGDGDDGDDDDNGAIPLCHFTETPPYIKGKLRPYQVEGVNWLLSIFHNNVNGILADEMGLGKTFQTVATISYLKFTVGMPGPHLVVVPKSVLGNWFREFRKWCPALNVYRFHGSGDVRSSLVKMHLKSPIRYDVIITTFDMVMLEKSTFQRLEWNYLIVDEAHKLKNNEGEVHQILDSLNTLHRLLITGTPLQNNLTELWALLHFLAPILFDDSESFNEWFDASSGEQDEEAVSRMHLILNPLMIRRLKADVNTGIPPKKEIYVGCKLSIKQRSWYLNVLARDAESLNKASGGRVSQLSNVMMQLRKVCNHPFLFDGGEDGPPFITNDTIITASGKMVLLDKLLKKLYNEREAKHKVLLFCQMTKMLDIIEDYLIYKGTYKFCRIDGNTTTAERDQQMAAFNNPSSEYFIFLLSTRAGGLGINLQAANNVILYDSDWNPQMDLQAQDRAHRIGQKRNVLIFRFITDGTLEERIYKRALKKLYLDAMVVQHGRITNATGPSKGGSSDKVSKEELMSMVKFGAEEIFKMRTEDVTDDDIDSLLKQGEDHMTALQAEVKGTLQASLASFKLGADESNLYDFEGINYSRTTNSGGETKMLFIKLDDQIAQDELQKMCSKYGEVIKAVLNPTNVLEGLVSFRTQSGATDALKALNGVIGECCFAARENDSIISSEMMEECNQVTVEKLGRGQRRQQIAAAVTAPVQNQNDLVMGRIPLKLPKKPNYPFFQLYNLSRLNHLYEMECEVLHRNWKRRTKINEGEIEEEKLTSDEINEREQLLSEGFSNWTYNEYRAFIDAITNMEIDMGNYAGITKHIVSKCPGSTKTDGEVKDYVAAFREKAHLRIPHYDNLEQKIEKTKKRIARRECSVKAIQWKMDEAAALVAAHEDVKRNACDVGSSVVDGSHQQNPDYSKALEECLKLHSKEKFPELDKKIFMACYDCGLFNSQGAGNPHFLAGKFNVIGSVIRSNSMYRFNAYIRTRSNQFFSNRVKSILQGVTREWEKATNVVHGTPEVSRKRCREPAAEDQEENVCKSEYESGEQS